MCILHSPLERSYLNMHSLDDMHGIMSIGTPASEESTPVGVTHRHTNRN